MLSLCIAVTAQLCIADQYRAASQRLSIYTFAHDVIPKAADADAVNRLGIKLSIIVSDVIEYWPLSNLKQACVGQQCIYYNKSCDREAMHCGYYEGLPFTSDREGNRPVHFIPEIFSIQYSSADSLKAAEKNIYLIVGSKTDPSYIPLTQLDDMSNSKIASCPTIRPGQKKPDIIEPGCSTWYTARSFGAGAYSTVTDFARFLGWSTSVPLAMAA